MVNTGKNRIRNKKALFIILFFIFLPMVSRYLVESVTATKFTHTFELGPEGNASAIHGIPFTAQRGDEIKGTITATGTDDNGDVSFGIMSEEDWGDFTTGGVYSYIMDKIYIFGERSFEYYFRSSETSYYFVFVNKLDTSSSVVFNYDDQKFNFGENTINMIIVGALGVGFVILTLTILVNFVGWKRGILS